MSRQKRLEFDANESEVVAKANQLIQARHSFTTYEQRIFAAMVAGLKKSTDGFELQRIPISRICSRSNSSDLYRRIEEITGRLTSQEIVIREVHDDGTREIERTNVFAKCTYREGQGYIEARFTKDMEPFLLRLQERFTLYLLTVFLRLRSKYSTQIYELLKMRQGIGRRTVSVEEFREILGIEDKYTHFFNLKDRVIEQAREELKDKADIYFTYNVIREGRTPVEIEFFIHENTDVIQELEESEFDNAKKLRSGKQESESKINPKKMFLSDRTQEEIRQLNHEEVEKLHQEAREWAIRNNSDSDREGMLIRQQTYQRMNQIWRG